jgi:PKD repeat protein
MKKAKAAAAKAKASKPRFDRSKLNSNFFNNAKSQKDEVQGWAFDFDNDQQSTTATTAVSNSTSKEE